MASENHAHHHSRRLQSRSVLVLVFLLLAYAVLFSWQSWQDAENEGTRQLATVAELGGKVLDSYFAQLEISMENLGKDLAGSRKQSDLDHAYAMFKRFQARRSELESVILMRADGQLLLTGDTPYSRELPTLADEPSFRKLRDQLQTNPSFVIGQPVSGHIDSSWVVPARYGITDQTGRLTHIISANLPIDLVRLCLADSARFGATSFGLIRDDGYLVSLYPGPDVAKLGETYGKPVAGALLEYLHANQSPQSGLAEGTDSAAPYRPVHVVHRLQHYPLTLFAEMPESEIKALWWGKVQVPYFLMTIMLAGLFAVQGWSFRRHKVWTQEQRREALRHGFEHSMLERSANEIYMFDADTLLFAYANDFALGRLGCSLEELQKRTFISLHPELSTATFARLIDPLRRREQESIRYRTLQARADGSTYPVEIDLQLLTSDAGNQCLAIINDISTLGQAEENIRRFNAPLERRAAGR